MMFWRKSLLILGKIRCNLYKMKIILESKEGNRRIEGSLDIQDIIFKEDISDLDNVEVGLDLENEKSKGIVKLSKDEVERLVESVRGKMKLVKESKKLKG